MHFLGNALEAVPQLLKLRGKAACLLRCLTGAGRSTRKLGRQASVLPVDALKLALQTGELVAEPTKLILCLSGLRPRVPRLAPQALQLCAVVLPLLPCALLLLPRPLEISPRLIVIVAQIANLAQRRTQLAPRSGKLVAYAVKLLAQADQVSG